jgi:hypothetical protein
MYEMRHKKTVTEVLLVSRLETSAEAVTETEAEALSLQTSSQVLFVVVTAKGIN